MTHSHVWDTTHSYVRHDSFMGVTWLIQSCDMTHSWVWHDSSATFTRRHELSTPLHSRMTHAHVWDMTHSCVWRVHITSSFQALFTYSSLMSLSFKHFRHNSFISLTYDTTHSHVRHAAFTWATWLIHIWDMTHSYVRHAAFTCSFELSSRLHLLVSQSHSYVWHDSFICATWLIHKCDMTHSYVLARVTVTFIFILYLESVQVTALFTYSLTSCLKNVDVIAKMWMWLHSSLDPKYRCKWVSEDGSHIMSPKCLENVSHSHFRETHFRDILGT